ncbi:MAG: hypothetical protein R3304_11265 [Longimicrobiales bacterium]|nr:hypothetical protein [Longimicrobiales bacterium]
MNRNTRPRPLMWMVLALGAVFGVACTDVEEPEPAPLLQVPPCDSQEFFQAVNDFVQADSIVRGGEDALPADYDQQMNERGVLRLDLLFGGADEVAKSETHDCQRLIVSASNGGLTYGPYVGILPAPNLAAPLSEGGRVVATILNHTPGVEYSDLGIEGGERYCVFMQRQDGAWLDALVFAAPSHTCRGASPPQAPDAVTRLTTTTRGIDGNPTPSDYPNTIRWMWDEDSRRQYIGLRCPTGWCELAPSGLTLPTTNFPVRDSVPGWFDRQPLAVVSGSGLGVSGLMGTIKPRPGVQFDTPAAQEAALQAGPMVAAEITLEGTDPQARAAYARKWQIPADSTRSDPSVHPLRLEVEGNAWRAWIPGQTKRILQPAMNVKHSGLRTVRWRWLESDEGGWLPCRGACCVWY